MSSRSWRRSGSGEARLSFGTVWIVSSCHVVSRLRFSLALLSPFFTQAFLQGLCILPQALSGPQVTAPSIFGEKACDLVLSIGFGPLGDAPAGTEHACAVPTAISEPRWQLLSAAGVRGPNIKDATPAPGRGMAGRREARTFSS